MQFRIRRAPVYRRVFSGAAISLAYGAASVTFHGLDGLVPPTLGGTLSRGVVWTLVIAASVLVKEVVNKSLVIAAVKSSAPAIRISVLKCSAASHCTTMRPRSA